MIGSLTIAHTTDWIAQDDVKFNNVIFRLKSTNSYGTRGQKKQLDYGFNEVVKGYSHDLLIILGINLICFILLCFWGSDT